MWPRTLSKVRRAVEAIMRRSLCAIAASWLSGGLAGGGCRLCSFDLRIRTGGGAPPGEVYRRNMGLMIDPGERAFFWC